MVWVFILGALYGIGFMLNIKICQYDIGVGAVTGILITGLSSVIALTASSPVSPQNWLLPFLAQVFFFMPNYVTAVNRIFKAQS